MRGDEIPGTSEGAGFDRNSDSVLSTAGRAEAAGSAVAGRFGGG